MRNRRSSLILLLAAPLLLTACDTQYMYETITGERPSQVVDGARRAPALNDSFPSADNKAEKMPPMVTNVPADSPFDSYDASGAPASNAASQDEGNAFTRWWGGTGSASPAASAVQAPLDAMRKPLPGNPHYSTETSQAAPPPDAPQTLAYPNLASVPPTPKRFGPLAGEHQQAMGELQADHAVAQQDKRYLEQEITQGNASMQVSAPAQLARPPVPVSSLPAVNVAASAAPSPAPLYIPNTPPAPVLAKAPAPAKAPAVVKKAFAPAPVPAPVRVSAPLPVAEAPVPYIAPSPLPVENQAEYAPLPSPEVIKIMRPSRYEQRAKQLENRY